jgi:hypothetical protein
MFSSGIGWATCFPLLPWLQHEVFSGTIVINVTEEIRFGTIIAIIKLIAGMRTALVVIKVLSE